MGGGADMKSAYWLVGIGTCAEEAGTVDVGRG